MVTKTENPDTFLIEYTNRLIIQHLLLVEDHLLEYAREPSSQCLACLYWHLEKLVAYTSLECVKFDGTDIQACQRLSTWASDAQVALEGLTRDKALELSKGARDFRYQIVEVDISSEENGTFAQCAGGKDEEQPKICTAREEEMKQDPILAEIAKQICGGGLCAFANPESEEKPVCTSKELKTLERCIQQVKDKQPKRCKKEWQKPVKEMAKGCYNPWAVCTEAVGCRVGRGSDASQTEG